MIPFNKPSSTGEEIKYIRQAIQAGHVAGNGQFTKQCRQLVHDLFGFRSAFFTPSCSAALEMAAMLCNFRPGDEVIMPSFTHVSTANSFIRARAVVRFADCMADHPNMDPNAVRYLINAKTRALVVVHYAGIACDMQLYRDLANEHGLVLIEDAAHALGARYRNSWLGSWGDLSAFSFHETKNINCGQGGMLVVNKQSMLDAATELWHHGTNRSRFEKGEVPFYTWVRPGGPFLLPELNAAFLYPQLMQLPAINERRLGHWKRYYELLSEFDHTELFSLPEIPSWAQHNAHIFYLIARTARLRDDLLQYLNVRGFQAVFHYVPLHASPYGIMHAGTRPLPNAERISTQLLRLPLYDSLEPETIEQVSELIGEWLTVTI